MKVHICKREGRDTDALIRWALAEERQEEPDPAAWTIARTEKGKPYFPLHPELHFSVSDSDGMFACVFSDAPVGLDLQRMRRRRDESCEEAAARLRKLADRFFAPDEAAYVREADSFSRFYEIWTAKEAYVKRLGTGVDEGFSSFSVRQMPEEFTWRIIDDYMLCVTRNLHAGGDPAGEEGLRGE